MEIEPIDDTKNINRQYFGNKNTSSNINNKNNEEDTEMNIFSKNNKCIYGNDSSSLINKNNKKSSYELTLCEGRLQNDLAELKRSKVFGKICETKFDDNYRKVNNNQLEFCIEFVSFFTVKFTFNSDYPFSPPIITYASGLRPNNIFDENGNVLIESIKKNNWTPSIWLSTLVYSIELLISSSLNNEVNSTNNNNNSNLTNYFLNLKKKRYGKRNWDVYLEGINTYYAKESILIPELENTLKQLKIKEN